MATVVRKAPGESDESLIAKFRRKVLADNILLELKEREFYKPPSVRKKERRAVLKKRK
jgi:ribosomal protein S21